MPTAPPIHRAPGWVPAQRTRTDAIDRRYGTREWRTFAAAIIKRDRGICSRCGQPGANTAHHRRHVRDGGGWLDPANAEAIHAGCHNAEHGKRG